MLLDIHDPRAKASNVARQDDYSSGIHYGTSMIGECPAVHHTYVAALGWTGVRGTADGFEDTKS